MHIIKNTNPTSLQTEPPEPTDKDLMIGIQSGDQKALETIIKRHGELLKNTIRHVLHNDSDTEDIVSQVLVELWRKASNYSSNKGTPLSWLLTIGHRKAIDHIRRCTAYSRARTRMEKAVQHTDQATTDKHGARDDCRLILEYMKEIPEDQAELLVLCLVYGSTQQEAATKAKIPLGTAKTRFELGLRKLKGKMKCK